MDNNAENTPRYFTLAELREYDGSDGKPVYVSVDEVVYDVSSSPLWHHGTHFGMIPGRELTINYKACHAGRPRLEQMPIVGYIKPPEK